METATETPATDEAMETANTPTDAEDQDDLDLPADDVTDW